MKNKNSVFKKALSVLLTALLVFGTVSLGIVFPETKVTANAALEPVGKLAFYVPEAVYLYPDVTSWKSTVKTPFQFFITNTVNTSNIYDSVPTPKAGTPTTDTIYFAYEKNTGTPYISYEWLDKNGNVMSDSSGRININSSAKQSGVVTNMDSTNGYFTVSLSASASNAPALAASQTGCYIRWTVTFKDSTDGRSKTAYAYTYVYKPNVQSVGGGVKMENDRGTNSFAEQLTWLTGIHSISGSGSRYPRYANANSAKGMAPFLSSTNIGYIGDSTTTSGRKAETSTYTQSSGATQMYAVFASTDKTKAYFWAKQTNCDVNNNWCGDWLTETASEGFASKSYDIKESKEGTSSGNSYNYINLLVSAKGVINIDTSRYSNLKDIPNLGIGLLVTDDKKADDGGAWMMTDYTGETSYRASENGHDKSSVTNIQNRWNKGASHTVIARVSSYNSFDGTAGNEEFKYGGAWNRDITGSNTTYSFKSFYINSDSDRSLTSVVIDLQTNKYDKSVLRSALHEVTSKAALIGFKTDGTFDSRYYDTTDATWTTFVNAYKKAFTALTVVDEALSDTPANIANALLTAAKNLKIKVALHGNNGTALTYKSVTVGLNELTNVSVTDFGTPVRKGYTFKGWTLTSNTGDATDGITSGTLAVGPREKDVYATWSLNDYTVTFKAMQYGKFGSSSDDVVIHYNVASSFTVPDNYTRDYYTFNNAWSIKQTGSSDWSIGMSLAPGFTSDVGKIGDIVLEPNVTPINYTAKFNSDGGSTVDDITYTIESTGVLPSASRPGYTFVGWSVVTTDDTVWSAGKTYSAGYKFTGMHGNVTLKAVWETLTSKVTLNLGDGETIAGSKELTYAYASSLTLNSPEKKGYTFKGWRVSATSGTGNTWNIGTEYLLNSGDSTVTLPGGMLGDVVLDPIWSANTYTVTYNSDGGTIYQPVNYTIEDTVNIPQPVKNGYTFAGWSVVLHDSLYNWTDTVYNGGASLTKMYGSVTLKANWSKTAYTVTFDANGGTVGTASLPYDIESGTPNLPTPSRTGYTFAGWEVSSTDAVTSWVQGTVYTDALPAGNYGSVTLKAKWNAQTYTITFSDGKSQQYTIEQSFTLPESVRDGYDFVKWTVSSTNGNWGDEGTAYTASDVISGKYGDVILNAEYTPRTYIIEYRDANGTKLFENTQYKTGESVTLEKYSKDGYEFKGWRVDTDGGNWGAGNVFSETAVSGKYGNVVLVPELDAVEYTVTFVTDGGNAVPAMTYTVEDTITLPSTEKYGYDLAGWTVDTAVGNWGASATFNAGAELTGKYGNVTLKAKWTAKIYDITFITGKGEQVVQSAYGQATPTLPADISKPSDAQYDYTFSHWEPALTTVTGNATYTAVYTETLREYTVTWRVEQTENAGDYTELKTTWKYGETPSYEGVPSQSVAAGADHKMRFKGWTPEVSPVTGDVTYTAVFEQVLNPQKVTWYNGSDVLAVTEWGVGEVPSYNGADPARPDENGYKFVFVGWASTDGGAKLDTLPAIVRGKDVSYYAVFEKQPQSYTLTFNTNGGTLTGGSTLNYTFAEANTEITFPAPEKTGYVFKGWVVESTDGTWNVGGVYNSGKFLVNAYGNAVLSAKWEAVTYTLTFAGDASGLSPMTYTIESDAVLPDAEKDGGELIGWLVSVGDGSWIQGTTVEPSMSLKGSYGNATLTPVYKAKTYKIQWISGDVIQEVEVQYGSAIYAYSPIAKQGYTAEWDKEIPATMPAHDLVFTAVYTPVEYFLRLNLNGGTGAESFYYNSDTDDVLPTPTRDGATFLGWRVISSNGNWNVGTLVAGGTSLKGKYGNVTLTAQWQLAIYTVTWVAGDETRVTRWYYGMTPSFDGTPYKSPDKNYSYVFTGWDKEISPVTGDVTYTAEFDKTERVYTVTWNVDGVTTVQQYSYGDMPVYGKETPSRASTSEYDFYFDGWSPEVSEVTDDVTYVAQFRVFIKLQGLSLNKSALFLDINASESLIAEIYPSTASAKDVLWSSSNEDIVTVDAVGKVTAVNAGVAIVSVSSGDGNFKSYCVVTVAPKLTSYIEITANGVSTTNVIGNSVQLYATVQPDDATDRTFKWTSDNPGIASVDEYGMVRFNSKGTTTIRVITTDGYAQGSIDVTSVETASEEEQTKTYGIRFLPIACDIYLIDDNGNRHTFSSEQIVCVPEGATIRFRPARPYYVIVNGVTLEQDVEYVIENVQKNYIISSSKAPVVQPDDPDDAPTFIAKLQQFFRKIVQFFKKLFGAK